MYKKLQKIFQDNFGDLNQDEVDAFVKLLDLIKSKENKEEK